MCLLLTVGSYGLFETQGELLTSAALSLKIDLSGNYDKKL